MVVLVLVVVEGEEVEEEGERCAAREARRVVAGEVEEADMHCSPVCGSGVGRGGKGGWWWWWVSRHN